MEGWATNSKYGTLYLSWSAESTTDTVARRHCVAADRLLQEINLYVNDLNKTTKIQPSLKQLHSALQAFGQDLHYLGKFPPDVCANDGWEIDNSCIRSAQTTVTKLFRGSPNSIEVLIALRGASCTLKVMRLMREKF